MTVSGTWWPDRLERNDELAVDRRVGIHGLPGSRNSERCRGRGCPWVLCIRARGVPVGVLG